jgi:hypothetical protein
MFALFSKPVFAKCQRAKTLAVTMPSLQQEEAEVATSLGPGPGALLIEHVSLSRSCTLLSLVEGEPAHDCKDVC